MGVWNGTALTLMQGDVKAVFSVTDTTIAGTWDDLVVDNVFSQESYTSANAFILQKQTTTVT